MIAIRVLSPDDWPRWREVRLAALAEAPDAFGSRLADWQGDGDTEERWRDRLEVAGSYNLLATLNGEYVGMVRGAPASKHGVIELLSLWVSPNARGKGVGDRLITAVIDWARRVGAHSVELCVRKNNEPATALYRRHDFRDSAEPADDARERVMVHTMSAPRQVGQNSAMEVLRYASFSADPAGGNPAGVVLDATGVDDESMLAVAAEVGYSETAFLVPRPDGDFDVRYFSPLAEVPFCGHATIAVAAAYADRHGVGSLALHTKSGLVTALTATTATGLTTATLVSVAPRTVSMSDDDLSRLLVALRWSADDLDPTLPPRVAYAGVWHPIIASTSRQRLATLDYDMAALGALMAERNWTTIDLVWRESATVFHARNPFPPGGVVEDPATGAAAAALGGYLRELALVVTPATVTVHQGTDMGRPSMLTLTIPVSGGVAVTGVAVPIPA